MYHKITTKNPDGQVFKLPAGIIPGDYATELFGVRETRKVFAICNGATVPFGSINPELKARIFDKMLKDDAAMADLQGLSYEEALEEYAFCLYGLADEAPDFSACGSPGPAENFRCGGNCRCMKWASKQITINGQQLTPREVEVTEMLNSDMPDKQIADLLKISPNTLTQHKRNLYDKAGVKSRPGLIEKAFTHRVIR